MNTRRRTARTAAVLAAGALIVAGCNGNNGDPPLDGPTDETTDSTADDGTDGDTEPQGPGALTSQVAVDAADQFYTAIYGIPEGDPAELDLDAQLAGAVEPGSQADELARELIGGRLDQDTLSRGTVDVEALAVAGDSAELCASQQLQVQHWDGTPVDPAREAETSTPFRVDATYAVVDGNWIVTGIDELTEELEVRDENGEPTGAMQEVPVRCLMPSLEAELQALFRDQQVAWEAWARSGWDPAVYEETGMADMVGDPIASIYEEREQVEPPGDDVIVATVEEELTVQNSTPTEVRAVGCNTVGTPVGVVFWDVEGTWIIVDVEGEIESPELLEAADC